MDRSNFRRLLREHGIAARTERRRRGGGRMSARGLFTRPASYAQATVLVIDDDEAMRRLATGILSEQYRVLEADGVANGLELLAKEPVDLVLMDVMMPGINGLDGCRSVKAAARGFLPVLMLDRARRARKTWSRGSRPAPTTSSPSPSTARSSSCASRPSCASAGRSRRSSGSSSSCASSSASRTTSSACWCTTCATRCRRS